MAVYSLASVNQYWPLLIGCLSLIPVIYYVWLTVVWWSGVKALHKLCDSLPGNDKRHWLFGHLHQHPGPNEKGLEYTHRKVLINPRLCKMMWGPFKLMVLVTHPDTVKQIFRSSLPKGLRGFGTYKLLQAWLGDGLLLASGDKWFRNRRLLTPAFHFDVLKPYMNIYNESSEKFLVNIEKASKSGPSVEIQYFTSLCTLDVILRCAFSYNADVQTLGSSHPYVNAVTRITKLVVKRLFSPLKYVDFVYRNSADGKEMRKHINYVHNVASEIIKKRKLTVLGGDATTQMKRHLDFLDILLLARDDDGKGLTDQEIRDEVDTFLFEGHDTTASAISWALYTFAQHPDHQERCRQEINDLLADRESTDLLWSDLQNMPYLTMCLKESMRIHSPVPFISRQCDEPFELDGYVLPKGVEIAVDIYQLHHNVAVWGADHMEFKPERFEPSSMEKMDSYAFCPFSAGPRNCIGQNFAMHEVKTIVAKTIHRFKLTVDPNHVPEHVSDLVMRSTKGIKLHFTPVESDCGA